jgi:hypothetical protein
MNAYFWRSESALIFWFTAIIQKLIWEIHRSVTILGKKNLVFPLTWTNKVLKILKCFFMLSFEDSVKHHQWPEQKHF